MKDKKSETRGACSDIVNDNHGSIEITCTGFSKKQLGRIKGLLEGISETQSRDQDELLRKMEQVLLAVKSANQPRNPNEPIVSYDLFGNRRSDTPGDLHGHFDTTNYNELHMLLEQRRWSELLLASRRNEQSDPGWDSPYFFEGVALFKTCKDTQAKERLELFLTRTDKDPNYSSLRSQASKSLAVLSGAAYQGYCREHPNGLLDQP